MQNLMGEREHKYQAKLKKNSHSKHSKRCGALCCGSRLSVSSSSSSEGIRSSDSEQLNCLLNVAHGMVQARLEQMIKERGTRNEWRRRDRIGGGSGGRCVVLIAMDKSSYDPREDFRRSILEVITSKGLEEPKELRSLLNCYMSMNSREHRPVILEAFHEVCSTLFLCNRRM
ncbi:probable transcription repressor OFP9 [Elaeis guineensis]|uniref:probable transcription repressor OFP9 n=1 Tax=Elaeis guineensis var. tenera TaxID=51953 RepID=UPI003C6CEB5E